MSRTYRKRKTPVGWNTIDYSLTDYVGQDELDQINPSDLEYISEPWNYYFGLVWKVKYTKKSKTGRKALAKYHSDSGTSDFRDPGPKWFKKMYTLRPYRRKCDAELQKYFKDNEYEVILEKIRYCYWT